MDSSNFSWLYGNPNKMFSLIVPENMKGSCSTVAIFPLIDAVPPCCYVSSSIEYKRVVLPLPTLPTTTKRSSYCKSRLRFLITISVLPSYEL